MRLMTSGLLATAFLGCVLSLGCKKEESTGTGTLAPATDSQPGFKASHKGALVPPPPPPPPPGQ